MNIKLVIYPVLLLACILMFFFFDPEAQKALYTYTEVDSLGHLLSFFFLAWLVHSILRISLDVTVVSLIVYGGLTELGQHFLGFRNGEFSDFFADTLGVLIYACCASLFLYFFRRRQKQ